MKPFTFVYHFDDSSTSEIAKGTIDALGYLQVTKIQEGQEDRVNDILDEYNKADRVFHKGARTVEGETHSRLTKTPVYRTNERFVETLIESIRRFYGVELRIEA